MEITLNFVSGHSICHMVIKNDDQSVVKKDILNEDVANVFSGLSTTDEIYAVPQFLKSKTPDGLGSFINLRKKLRFETVRHLFYSWRNAIHEFFWGRNGVALSKLHFLFNCMFWCVSR